MDRGSLGGASSFTSQSCTNVRLTNRHAHYLLCILRLKLLYPGAAWPPPSALRERYHFRPAFTHCFGLSLGLRRTCLPPLSDIAPYFPDTTSSDFDISQRNGMDLTICIYLHLLSDYSFSDYSHHCTPRQSPLAFLFITSQRTIRTYCRTRIRCTLHPSYTVVVYFPHVPRTYSASRLLHPPPTPSSAAHSSPPRHCRSLLS